MSDARKRRGRQSEHVVADYLRRNGFDHAEPVGAGRSGTDVTGTFTARFAGTCPACWQSIAEGHDLTWDDDHQAIHAECRHREPKPTPVCPRCFQATSVTRRCGCDE